MIGGRTEKMDEEAFTDIANAIMRLRQAFLRHHLQPPIALEIGSREDATRLRASMPRDLIHAQPQMRDKGPEIVFNLAGVEFRCPAEWRAIRQDGVTKKKIV